jgi:hypothetical protein
VWTLVAAKQTRAEIRVNSVTFFLASSSQYFHHNGLYTRYHWVAVADYMIWNQNQLYSYKNEWTGDYSVSFTNANWLKNTKHFSFIQGHECAGGFSGKSQMRVAIFDAERMIRFNEISYLHVFCKRGGNGFRWYALL